MIPRELEDRVVEFTDAGTWKHSWHWDRDMKIGWHPITLKGAKQMLHDLACDTCHGNEADEIEAAMLRIRKRYRLAEELRTIIAAWEAREVADHHSSDCTCSVCVAAGYADETACELCAPTT